MRVRICICRLLSSERLSVGERVIPITSWPAATSIGTGGRPIVPVAQRRRPASTPASPLPALPVAESLLGGRRRRIGLAGEIPVLGNELARDERRALRITDDGRPHPRGIERLDDHLAAELRGP